MREQCSLVEFSVNNVSNLVADRGFSVQSVVTFEVKPWDDETDMAELEKAVRSIEMPGLVWGASKLVAIGYGIKKLQVTIVVGMSLLLT